MSNVATRSCGYSTWEHASDPDKIADTVNRFLRKYPVIDCGEDGARQYAMLSRMIAGPLMDGEAIEPGSPLATTMQAMAHGVAFAVLDRLRTKFQWSDEQDDEAFEALTEGLP